MTNEDLTAKVFELDERATRHTEQIKTAFKQIEEIHKLTDSVNKLATSVELLAHEQKSLGTKVDDLSGDMEEIKNRPAKKWDSASNIVLTVIITAIVTFVLTQLGIH